MTSFDALLRLASDRSCDPKRKEDLAARRTSLSTASLPLLPATSLIDLLGEIPGGGTYQELAAGAVELQLFGTRCLCLSLAQLIRAKRAAGRPKDWEALAELEAIDEERQS